MKIKFHFTFFVVLIVSFFLKFQVEFLLAFGIIVLHELAHVFTAGLIGIKLARFEILPFGVSTKFKREEFDPAEEIVFSAAGPFLNFCLFFLFFYLNNEFLMMINAALFITNILPIVPLDGGRIIRAILTIKWNTIKAYNFTKWLSRVILAFAAIGAFSLLFLYFNFSGVLICCFLINNLIFEDKSHTFLMMKNGLLVDKKISKMPIRTEILTVTPNTLMCKVLKLFSGGRFVNVQVVDGEKGIVKTMTEGEILSSLRKNGIRSIFFTKT